MLNPRTNLWTLFTNSAYYFTSGNMNTDLTVLENLFSDNPLQIVWKIELAVEVTSAFYPNQTYQGLTSMQIFVNFPPLPGVCDVNPKFGNSSDQFFITCNSWSDPGGGIINYVFYGKIFFKK